MNKPIKIILLLVAILLAVGGVFAYYKTIVSPPGKLDFSNQYVNAAKKDLSKVESANTDLALDTIFVGLTHELDFLWYNSFISDQERDELMQSFATLYVPTYVSSCNSKFNKSVWHEDELRKIDARIAELQALRTTDKRIIIQGEANASLNKVHNVIVNYYDARKAASASQYYGLESAKQRIAAARKYALMSPINKCSDLVLRLNSVPSRLEKAHYDHLKKEVERLRNYNVYSKEKYEDLAWNINSKLDEYDRHAKSVYGMASNISDLKRKAGSYYSMASSYYSKATSPKIQPN
jgi:hypothetical protein